MSFFSLDSKFMQIMTRVAELMILNAMFLLTCIPIITIGTSTTALYTVCFRFDTEQEGRAVKTYFSAFRESFPQATLMWLAGLIAGVAMVLNALLCFVRSGGVHFGTIAFIALFLLVIIVSTCVFSLMSLFKNSFKRTITNAFLLGLGNLPRIVLAAAMNAFPIVLWLVNPYRFIQFGFLWVAIYFSLATYLNTRILKKVFEPYIPDSETEE